MLNSHLVDIGNSAAQLYHRAVAELLRNCSATASQHQYNKWVNGAFVPKAFILGRLVLGALIIWGIDPRGIDP